MQALSAQFDMVKKLTETIGGKNGKIKSRNIRGKRIRRKNV